VLAAMGLAPEEARRVVRISAGWETTEADWKALAAAITKQENEFRTDNANVVKI
jgi:cysteine desulfurase